MKPEAIYSLRSGQNLWEPDGTMLQVVSVNTNEGRVRAMVETGPDACRERSYSRLDGGLERLKLRPPRRAR